MNTQQTTLLPLLKLRYWPVWGLLGLLWCLTRLPYQWQLAVGRQLGNLTYYLAHRRRQIADLNLAIGFPELSEIQRHQLLRRHFQSLGMGLLETLNARWIPDSLLNYLCEVSGWEHFHAALAQGKGVILLSAHFHTLEMGGRFVAQQTAIHVVYRPHENPVIDYFFKYSREKYVEKMIARDNVKEMLRCLKHHQTLWYASDQNYGHKHSVFANFLGIPAATNTAISRLARSTNAVIVPFFTQRLDHYRGGYKIIFHPALTNFPSDDPVQDATRINQFIEAQIRQAPEQYFWVHRRFKDRPEGEESIYP